MCNTVIAIKHAATDEIAVELFHQALEKAPDDLSTLWSTLLRERPAAAQLVEEEWPAIRVVAREVQLGHEAQ